MLIVRHGDRKNTVSNITRKIAPILTIVKTTDELQQQLTQDLHLTNVVQKAVLAAYELSKRLQNVGSTNYTSPLAILPLLERLRKLKQEAVQILFFDLGMKYLGGEVLFKGTDRVTLFSPREIFLQALNASASRVIIAHNHPSGNVSPSTQDLKVTKDLVSAGLLLGIEVVDHLIISRTGEYSFTLHGHI